MSYIYNSNEKGATKITHDYNVNLLKSNNSENHQIEIEDTEDAKSHLILKLEGKDIYDDDSNLIYDSKKYPIQQFPDFPDTVNPYLWQINKDNSLILNVIWHDL